ncbi:MAG TPA: hypothetical protein VJ761_02905 [Ktedonobacteraceae bacterium]|nr:hypothetical protein [Ktedonobacteraceae bacterium]
MKTIDHLQTMALTYQEICQGERPWVALGNFMNDWFDYAKDRRAELVADPISLPDSSSSDALRWAAFCTASVEWLCERYNVPCSSWVRTATYCLPESWFDAPQADKPQVREWLIRHTPELFTRRNIFCGDRIFANKYEFVEQYRRLSTPLSPPTPV